MIRFAQSLLFLASFVALLSTVQPAAAGRYSCKESNGAIRAIVSSGRTDNARQPLPAAGSGCGINPRHAFDRQRGYASPR